MPGLQKELTRILSVLPALEDRPKSLVAIEFLIALIGSGTIFGERSERNSFDLKARLTILHVRDLPQSDHRPRAHERGFWQLRIGEAKCEGQLVEDVAKEEKLRSALFHPNGKNVCPCLTVAWHTPDQSPSLQEARIVLGAPGYSLCFSRP